MDAAQHSGAAIGFGRAFLAFARWRAAVAGLLLALGALFDGVGLLLLVPILGIVMQSDRAPIEQGSIAGPLMRWLGGYDQSARLALLLALFVGLIAARSVVHSARDRFVSRLQLEFVEAVRLDLVAALGQAGWTRLMHVSHARVNHALGSNVDQLGLAASWAMLGAVALAMLAMNVMLALLLAPTAGAIAIVLALLGAPLCHLHLRRAFALGRVVIDSNLGRTRSAMNFLAGLKLATAHGLEQQFVDEQRLASATLLRDRLQSVRCQIGGRNATMALAALVGAATVLIGVAVLRLPAPVLLTLLVVLSRMNGPALMIQQAAHHVLHNLPAFAMIAQLRADLEVPDSASRPMAAPVACGAIALRQAQFHHPRGAGIGPVDLVIAPGAFIGICGPSGAGKTIFLDLVAGLLVPQTGSITIGGQPLSAGLRERLAYVTQEPYLFDDTIRRNLAWSRADATAAEMWDALARVDGDALVRRLEHGLDTRIGERGVLLSAGERQRLALARALLRRPWLLVLDEATNAIDIASERAILEGLTAMPETTILLVAHRRESLALCDRVIEFPVVSQADQNTQFAPKVRAVP